MGFDVNRFANSEEMNEDLICNICKGVLEEGVWAPTCEHAFCKVCITQWLRRRNVCPNDRQHLNLNLLKPIPRFMRNLLDKLQIKCDFVSNGCQQVFKLESLRSHVTVCDFNPEKRVECVSGCGLIVKKADLQSHNCVESLRKHINEENIKYEQNFSQIRYELSSLRAENKSNRSLINNLQNDIKRLMSEKQTVISSAPSITQTSMASVSSNFGSHRAQERCTRAPNPYVLITPLQPSSALMDEPSSSTFISAPNNRLRNEEPTYKRRSTTIRVATTPSPMRPMATTSHYQYQNSPEDQTPSQRYISSATTFSISNDSSFDENDGTLNISESLPDNYINLEEPDFDENTETEIEVEEDLSVGIIEEPIDSDEI